MAVEQGQEQVSGSVKAPAWALGIILTAILGGGAIVGMTGSGHPAPVQAAPVALSHDSTVAEAQRQAQAAIAAQAAATAATLSRIEGKIDTQAGEIATVREGLAEIRGELKGRKR